MTGGAVKMRPCGEIPRPARAVHAPNRAASDYDEFECEKKDEPSDPCVIVTLECFDKSSLSDCRPTSDEGEEEGVRGCHGCRR